MSEKILGGRAHALEEEYFNKKNLEALERLKKSVSNTSSMTSPISNKPMVHEVFCGINIFLCEESNGIWIGEKELVELLSRVQKDINEEGQKWDEKFFENLADHLRSDKHHGKLKIAEQGEPSRKSPSTGEIMEKIEIDSIVVDRCPTSRGIWFDANELETLLEKAKTPEIHNESWVHTFFPNTIKWQYTLWVS